MRTTTKRRIAVALSTAAISTVGLGLAAATTAAAAPADVTGAASGAHAHVTSAAATPGTYEAYFNSGSGFYDAGPLYLNADTSWSLADYTDGGTWYTVGKTLGMSDYNAGYTYAAALGAKVNGTNLGSAAKPGKFLAADDASLTFYATFVSGAVPANAARSGLHALAAGAATASAATFPGTYNTTVGGTSGYQTVYNSDGTWSMPGGYCNAGSYLSFKVKSGTKVTYTDIQADEGCGVDHLWMAKEHGTTKLGSATKPGIIAEAALGGVYNSFYSVLAP